MLTAATYQRDPKECRILLYPFLSGLREGKNAHKAKGDQQLHLVEGTLETTDKTTYRSLLTISIR